MKYIEKQVSIENKNLIPDNSLFFDIETTGFSRQTSRIYLIGSLAKENNQYIFRQYLTQNKSDEKALLNKFNEKLQAYSNIITFNGESFDMKFIEARSKKHNVNIDFSNKLSIDLYKQIKEKSYFLDLENYKLKTLEKFLGIFREDIFTGGDLINLYYEYEKGDYKLEDVLLLHNEEDILNLPRLFEYKTILQDSNTIWVKNNYFCINKIKLNKNLLKISGTTNMPDAYLDTNNKTLSILENQFNFKSTVLEEDYDTNTKCLFVEKDNLKLLCRYNIPAPEQIFLLKYDSNILYKNIKEYLTMYLRNIFL